MIDSIDNYKTLRMLLISIFFFLQAPYNVVSYSIAGDASGFFQIDSAGVLSLKSTISNDPTTTYRVSNLFLKR